MARLQRKLGKTNLEFRHLQEYCFYLLECFFVDKQKSQQLHNSQNKTKKQRRQQKMLERIVFSSFLFHFLFLLEGNE